MNEYEVVIIGAGPGGLKCAEKLGKNGKSVLILEKNKKIGPKICAGGLTRKAYQILGNPSDIIDKKFNHIFFKSPKQRIKIDFGEDFVFIVNREKLAQWQLKKIEKYNNIKIKSGVRVERIFHDHIETSDGKKVFFEKIVGADGATSILRKFLGLKSNLLKLGFHYVLPKEKIFKKLDLEIFFNSKFFSAWYSWIFPWKNYYSIGSVCSLRVLSFSQVKDKFNNWLEKNKIDFKKDDLQVFPINCDYKGFSFRGNKFFLIGEAAGLASSFTGEGIYQALASGDDVAEIILKENHNPKKIKKILKEKRVHDLMLKILLFFSFLGIGNFIFELVVFSCRNKKIARFLLRILT